MVQGLSKAFTERACRYLNSQLSHLGDQVLSSTSNMKGSARRSVPDHRHIRQRACLLKPLMQVCLYAMDAGLLLLIASVCVTQLVKTLVHVYAT